MTSTTSTARAPRFATVAFHAISHSEPIAVLRVPVAAETTIKQLAKGAMQRLVSSRRGNGTFSASSMVVTGVYVGGGTQPKAEVFSHDLVDHVVLLREEMVHLQLQLPLPAEDVVTAGSPAPSSESQLSESAPPLPPAKASCDAPLSLSACAGPSETTPPQCHVRARRETKRSRPAPEEEPEEESSGGVLTRSAARRARVEEEVVVEKAAQETVRKESKAIKKPGWGPEAYKNFAENYVSSPEKLMRRKKAEAKQKAAAESAKALEKPPQEPVQRKAAEDSKVIRKPGWGPEAYKNFAANFVNSPDRLMRELRAKKKEEEARRKAAAAHLDPTVISDDDVVRKLSYDDEDDESGDGERGRRDTVGHAVFGSTASSSAHRIGKPAPSLVEGNTDLLPDRYVPLSTQPRRKYAS